jgi:hypothetical protein
MLRSGDRSIGFRARQQAVTENIDRVIGRLETVNQNPPQFADVAA